jgi:hypothetical protein
MKSIVILFSFLFFPLSTPKEATNGFLLLTQSISMPRRSSSGFNRLHYQSRRNLQCA